MAEPSPQPATAQDTLNDLLRFSRQHRRSTPLRRALLQDADQRDTPGPLHHFVVGRRELAFDLYLLLHCGAAASPFDVVLPAMAWARALNRPQTITSETTVSKNFTWLEQQRLVRSQRARRLRKVYLLREDASGQEYTRPAGGEGHGFFHLPFAYFTERWHQKLSLRAKATLIICLAQAPTFELRTEHATGRYGLSADSLQRGLDELRDQGLLTTSPEYRPAPRARLGFTQVHIHELQGDFARSKSKERALGKVARSNRRKAPQSKTTSKTKGAKRRGSS